MFITVISQTPNRQPIRKQEAATRKHPQHRRTKTRDKTAAPSQFKMR
jgi:hypothetical protein